MIKLLRHRIAEDDYHLTSGFVGLPYLLTELTECGLGDLAWRIATQETYPGWFDMIFTRKNSVFMESWDGGHVQMPSLAASIGTWFFRSLGGLRPETPGFKTFIIQPYTETLEWVKCSYESPYGRIVSNWKREDGRLVMEVTVPANTSATVHVPSARHDAVTESGVPAGAAPGVTLQDSVDGRVVLRVQSGTYRFEAPVPHAQK